MRKFTMTGSKDLIIIGAGIAGSSMAATMAERGWDVLLLDRDCFPRHKVCGEFLSPEAQSSLRTLALEEQVAARKPISILQTRLVTQQGVTLQTALPGSGWGVSRHALDHVLVTAAQRKGAEFCAATTVLGYEPCKDGYRVHVRGPGGTATLRTRGLVAACGRYTASGLPPQTSQQPRRDQRIGVKAHFVDLPTSSTVELYFFPGGYAGVGPVEAGRVNVCLLATYAAFAQSGRQVAGLISAAARWNPALGQRLAGGRLLPETALAVAPVDTLRQANPWDGIACLGDTGVMIPPLCGDGMAMALRSAELCAPLAHAFLGGRLSLAAWAESYCRSWHIEFDRRIGIGRLLQRALDIPSLANGLLRLGQMAPGLAGYVVQATRGRPTVPSSSVAYGE